MSHCTQCGGPADHTESHHHNQRKGDNDPDNLRNVDRRCHMEHHGNDRAVDNLTEQRYGPQRPRAGPP